LPRSAGLSLAVRQTRRVAAHAGDLVEGLGVVPDAVHKMTRADVLEGDVDLMARAVRLLANLPTRRLDADVHPTEGGLCLDIHTRALDRVDVYVDGRPRVTLDVTAGEDHVSVDVPEGRRLDLRGFEGNGLVARRRIAVD
jgi:hypothetical protein